MISEISGSQVSLRNLNSQLQKLDLHALKQQGIIYNQVQNHAGLQPLNPLNATAVWLEKANHMQDILHNWNIFKYRKALWKKA